MSSLKWSFLRCSIPSSEPSNCRGKDRGKDKGKVDKKKEMEDGKMQRDMQQQFLAVPRSSWRVCTQINMSKACWGTCFVGTRLLYSFGHLQSQAWLAFIVPWCSTHTPDYHLHHRGCRLDINCHGNVQEQRDKVRVWLNERCGGLGFIGWLLHFSELLQGIILVTIRITSLIPCMFSPAISSTDQRKCAWVPHWADRWAPCGMKFWAMNLRNMTAVADDTKQNMWVRERPHLVDFWDHWSGRVLWHTWNCLD